MAYTAKTAFFADIGVTMFQAGVEEKTEESMMRHNAHHDPPLLGIQPRNALHGYIPDAQPHSLWSL
jgi:hypothetical protein